MIAVDTNILVYAHREDSIHHAAARHALASLTRGRSTWGMPWPCLHEFVAIVTHPRIYSPPTQPADALGAVGDLLALRGADALSETEDHLDLLRELVVGGRIAGPRVHDARVAAICLGHSVHELLSADRDFGLFPALRVRNPLTEPTI